MTHDEMITKVIRAYGFESEDTIRFCNLVVTIENKPFIGCDAYLEGYFTSMMEEVYKDCIAS